MFVRLWEKSGSYSPPHTIILRLLVILSETKNLFPGRTIRPEPDALQPVSMTTRKILLHPRHKSSPGICPGNLKQPDDIAVIVDSDRLGGRHAGKAGHGHDIPGNHHHKFSSHGQSHIPDRNRKS